MQRQAIARSGIEQGTRPLGHAIPSGTAHTVDRPVAVAPDANVDVITVGGAAVAGPQASDADDSSGIPTLDLFAGAGGLSLGLRAAGFTPIGAVEVVPDAAATYNGLHSIDVIEARVDEADLASFRGEAQVVVGGPPCQPWSTGGLRRGGDDGRDGFPEFLAALAIVEPEAFLMENVPGLARPGARSYYTRLLAELKALGFHVESKILDAADFGVPQRRLRMFVVGTREKGFAFPQPTHGPDAAQPWESAGSVLAEEPLGEPNPSIVTYAKNPHLRPSPFDGLLFNGGGRPIDLDAPARTILASAGGNKTQFIDRLAVVGPYHARLWEHFTRHGADGLSSIVRSGAVPGARRITVAESAALQSFDPSTSFHGTRSTQYKLVGNAVPPKLATAVGSPLASALLASSPL
jgi:DNA (cytosine-5)-methyltransferase 1